MCGYVPGVNGPDSEESEHGVGGDAATGETAAALAAPPEVTTEAPSERTFEAPETRGHTLLAIDTSLGTAVASATTGRFPNAQATTPAAIPKSSGSSSPACSNSQMCRPPKWAGSSSE